MSNLSTVRTPARSGHPRLLQAVIALGLVLSLGACKRASNEYAPPPPPEVTVAHPERKEITRFLEYTGTTEAREEVELRARVTGFLDRINFKPGAAVKKDDLLFVIDPRVYQAQAQQAEADLAAQEATLRLAEITLKRFMDAAESSAASPQEIDRAVAERDHAQAQADLARASLVQARLNVEFTEVRSPIDGRITRNFVDVGNLVGAGGQSTVLATVVSSGPLYVTIDCSESDLLMVRRKRIATEPGAEPGQIAPGEWRPVRMASGDSDAFDIHGQIDYVDPVLNPQTGTIRVRCRAENENGLLLPGMFVRARILLDTSEEIVVPDTALLSDQSGRYALVVGEGDVVEMRRVRIGALDGQMRVVAEGLTPSDRVIVNGLQRARPGSAVKPTLSPSQHRGASEAEQNEGQHG